MKTHAISLVFNNGLAFVFIVWLLTNDDLVSLDKMRKVKTGMSVQEIVSILGNPIDVQAYNVSPLIELTLENQIRHGVIFESHNLTSNSFKVFDQDEHYSYIKGAVIWVGSKYAFIVWVAEGKVTRIFECKVTYTHPPWVERLRSILSGGS